LGFPLVQSWNHGKIEDMNELEVYAKHEIGEVFLGTVAEIFHGKDCWAEMIQLFVDVIGDTAGKVGVNQLEDFTSQISIELRPPTGF